MNRSILSIAAAVSLTMTALAQGPGQPNEGSRITRDAANHVITLSWWGRTGQSYFVQHSDDLQLWSYCPVVVEGKEQKESISLNTSASTHYLRLEYELTSLNLDSDSDGIPDAWEVLHGLDPHDPNDAFTMAQGGLTYMQKYTLGLNPAMADSDGDGMPDNLDMYPGDSRRTDAIPAKFYAVTNLSSYLPDAVKGSFNAKQVALDDSHNAAFFGTSDSVTGNADVGHVFKYQGGTLSEFRTFPMNQMSSSSSFGYAISSFSVNGINTPGLLATTTETHYDGVNGYDTFWTPWPLTTWPTSPASDYPTDDHKYGEQVAVNGAGDILAWDLQWQPSSFGYHYRTLFNNQVVFALSEGTSSLPYPYRDYLFCYGLNVHGDYLVSTWQEDAANPGHLKKLYIYCKDGVLYNAPEGIEQIRGTTGAHQAIGGYNYYDGTSWRWKSWFAVEDSSGNWTDVPLLNLLKWDGKPAGTRDDWDKYHSALRDIRITHITEPDPATAGVVITGRTYPNGAPAYIYFRASVLVDGNPTTGQADVWSSSELCMELQPEGYYSLTERRAIAGENETAPPIATEFMAAGNTGGTTAGNNSDGTARLQSEFEFVADNLYLGFDPPLSPGNGTDSLTPDLHDFDHPQWWTVVSAPDGKTDGAPFATNTNVKIWRNTKTPAPPQMIALTKIPIPPANKAAITVANNALSHNSHLSITGVRCAAGRQPDTAIVYLYNKKTSSNAKNGDAQAVLNVDILPKRTVKIGLWHLDDQNPNIAQTSPAYFMQGDKIVARLNEVFRQACLQFELEPAGERRIVPYTGPYGETLNRPGWTKPIQYLDTHDPTHMSKLGKDGLPVGAGRLHIILYRYMRLKANAAVKLLIPPDVGEKQAFGMFYRPSGNPKNYDDRVFVETAAFSPPAGYMPHAGFVPGDATDPYYEDFLLTICHEIGHALGINLWNHQEHAKDGHDVGAFPGALYNYDGTPVGDSISDARRKLNPLKLNFWFAINNRLLPRNSVDAAGNKRRILSALMTGGDNFGTMAPGIIGRSLWIRHEDWKEANINAAGFEPQP